MHTIEIKTVDTVPELRALMAVCEKAFDSPYVADDAYLEEMLNQSHGVYLGAYDDKRLVGGVVAFALVPLHGTKELYLYDIAVHPEYQRQGIGAMLIAATKEEAIKRDIRVVFVEAEADDDGAVAFYRAIGATELSVTHFTITTL